MSSCDPAAAGQGAIPAGAFPGADDELWWVSCGGMYDWLEASLRGFNDPTLPLCSVMPYECSVCPLRFKHAATSTRLIKTRTSPAKAVVSSCHASVFADSRRLHLACLHVQGVYNGQTFFV
jgi:hypothetical protein